MRKKRTKSTITADYVDINIHKTETASNHTANQWDAKVAREVAIKATTVLSFSGLCLHR